ncbi:MAG: HEPN domain-containing protein [Bacteroidales bacterium]|jgi:HEPN domain-containing protein|nr:HEPN domain-containing protein [Bacteroidales bacterium]
MPAKLVTETSFQLFNSAEGDILILNSWIEDKKVPDDWKNDQICNHATQTVEKMLKGFIIQNGQQIEKTHNIVEIWIKANAIDNSFDNIKMECHLLNNYTTSARYGFHTTISQQEIEDIIKAVKTIYFFPLLKTMREIFSQQKDYRLLQDLEFTKQPKENNYNTNNTQNEETTK